MDDGLVVDATSGGWSALVLNSDVAVYCSKP
jgi:hypothetical protein